MQAVRTKYFGPGNVRGARVKATCAARSIAVPWNHALNSEANHRAAAERLITVLGWNREEYYGRLFSGQLADGSYVHVLSGREHLVRPT